jgi:hypothetical protein
MPTVNHINPEQLPGGISRYGNQAVEEAAGELRSALRHNTVVHVTPSPYERTAPIAANYRKAAKLLGVGISIRHGATRAYRTLTGEEANEARELYICITKAKAAPPGTPAPAQPRIVDTLAMPPIVTAPAGYEASAIIPGLEVSR